MILLIQAIEGIDQPIETSMHGGTSAISVQLPLPDNTIVDAITERPDSSRLKRLVDEAIIPALYAIGDRQARNRGDVQVGDIVTNEDGEQMRVLKIEATGDDGRQYLVCARFATDAEFNVSTTRMLAQHARSLKKLADG